MSGVLASLESSSLAIGIRDSLYLFPLIESFHVVGLTLVFGTTVIIDLRLLGMASALRPYTRITSDTLKWTWAAFVLTAMTGALMFMTSASVYYDNFFFRTKMVLLALSGINVLIFEFTTGRTVHRWDRDAAAPVAGRTTAVLSLLLWVAIIFMGRWIGYTTSEAEVEIDPGIDLEDLFTPPPGQGGAPDIGSGLG